MTQKIIDKIVKGLTKKGFEVFDNYPLEDGNYTIFAEEMILHYEVSSQILTVSFLVSAVPDFVGNVILVLSRIEEVEIVVAESFFYGDSNEVITGEKAHEKFDKIVVDRAVEAFVKEQSQLNMLRLSDCYKA